MPNSTLHRRLSRPLEKFSALNKQHKIAIAGVSTLGAAAIALSAVPGGATTVAGGTPAVAAKPVAAEQSQTRDLHATLSSPLTSDKVKLDAIAAKQKAAARQKAADAAKKAAAERKAAESRSAKKAADRSAKRPQMETVAAKTYRNNLDGWIRQSLDIMRAKGIPGSYHGLHKNIMRESSGNPRAINGWDINAVNGVPSKGLLQVIPPTFSAYHVKGTSWDIYDPVANITAAANYAAHRYGTIDNVNSAY
ncbi:transglycosylase SLT domain-containing protein [Streptomyces sp. SID1328]|uniref:transglycosylase SLT domain-containing protein n=1 Tax=Streptomyces sp. SID1328 TaxID=2690250 RepID=UPI00136A603E|nr:transglycosylase SLT domain-containing protein [Streptomyces sp. SID1328]MYV38216.1 transglycosylase SLT domain-containing protein [Streptomyces sp. SID1328]